MSLLITAVFDGPLPGGQPKGIELFSAADIADLAAYGIGSANNGGGTDGEEFTLSGSMPGGEFLYVAGNAEDFDTWFGFASDFRDGSMSINGDDAIELFRNGSVIDVFGDIDVDGTGAPWEYQDGWAASAPGRMASPVFDPTQWIYSGIDALDGVAANATAANPVPIGSYTAGEAPNFALELLHFADQEAASGAVTDAPNLSAVLNALRAQDLGNDGAEDYTITISSGDAFIPGVFFDAGAAVFGSPGIADIQIQNELGVQAITLGNHEFDLGTAALADLISGDTAGDFSALNGTALDGLDFTGTVFPYLSANLDISTDANLAGLEIAGGQAPQANAITSSTVLTVTGADGEELVGVVGATTPTLAMISSSGGVTVLHAGFSGTPSEADLDALAAIIQTEVDALLDANPEMNKVILAAHMQQIAVEQALAERLTDVDIIIAGGSNTRLFDDNDRPRDGESDQGQYPQFFTNAGGTTTALVNTDGSYKYVGRLVIEFDADGNIVAESYDETVSGAYATDAQGVVDLGAEGLIDPEIQAIADAIEAEIVATQSNVFGVSDVFLNGNRGGGGTDGVRTQETNLGNLTADANLAVAKSHDDSVLVSIKNGGGIRASIGQTVVPPGGREAVRLPNGELVDGDGNIVKPEGGISQTDIQTTLAFNNQLTLLTLTREDLIDVLEHGIAASTDQSNAQGRFPQVSGVKFSFDLDLPAGERIVTAGIFDEAGTLIAPLVQDGALAGDASETFRVVTLNFLAGGGDGYPFPTGPETSRVDLNDLDGDGVDDGFTGDATFAEDGSEQDALAEFLDDRFNPANGGAVFDRVDTPVELDERIQNLDFRADTIFSSVIANPVPPVATEESGEIAEFAAFDSGVGEGGSEVVAYEDGRLYVTNGAVGAIDVWDLATQAKVRSIDLTYLPGFDGVQSVAVRNGLVAAAVSTPDVTSIFLGEDITEGQPGYVVLIDAASGLVIDRVTVGNLPDMVTFNEDGTKILVANEGEFTGESDLDRDPIGSVSIIDVSGGALDPIGTEITFAAFDGLEALAREKGIRLNIDASLLRGLEPEYISVEGGTAYISLQEANAFAVLDIANGVFTDLVSFSTVDHSVAGFEIDPNDDGKIEIRTFDDLVGLRMPDAIDTFSIGGKTYLITANEGDGRGDITDGPGDVPNPQRADEARVGDILAGEVAGVSIDASVDTEGLERLTISLVDGDTDGDGDIDVLHAFGSRSFRIFDSDGNVVFDSGSQFEAILAQLASERFNNDDGESISGEGDNRSDAKGPEPEAVTVGEVGGSLYAFIGLERDSGIMVYNIDDPANATFVDYIPGFGGQNGDHVAPETIAFIPADESASGAAQIAVAYEVSGETVVYDLGTVIVEPVTPQISEFRPNPDGTDPALVEVELTGTPGTSFDLWLLSVESDAGSSAGTVDRAENVTGTFGANGIAVVQVPDLENPSFTYILADDFTGTVGATDFDTDDDGTPDNLGTLGTVFDAIGMPDTDGEPLYGAVAGGTDLTFANEEPQLLFRDGATGEIYRVESGLIFDAAGNEVDSAEFDVDPAAATFGSVNPIRVGLVEEADLQVTEIWAGQDGENVTEDWFEITNFGTMAWQSVTSALFYDDESADVDDADAIMGIGEIAAGESAIVVIGTADDAAQFRTVWGDVIDLTGIEVGYTDGAGLGAGGDAVSLYEDLDGTLSADDLVDSEAYSDTAGFSGRSWDVGNAQFSEVATLTNVVATTTTGGQDGTEPAVGSPGRLAQAISASFTPIFDIQGTGDASALAGQEVTTRGVVTASFLGADEIGGFFLQDMAGDGDDATSDGIFVFDPEASVEVGDYIELTGTVAEFFEKTQISEVTSIATLGTGSALPEAVQLAVNGTREVENLEGMRVELVTPVGDGDGNLAVTETFSLGRFGTIEVAPEKNVQPTQVIDPTAANAQAIADLAAKNFAERFVVDDGSSRQNREEKTLIDDGAGRAYDVTDPQTAEGPTLRVGAEFTSITGVMDYTFGDYVLQYDIDAEGPLTPVAGTNDRPDLPDVGGDIQVASFNVLNFFTTLDDGNSTTLGGLEPRGANDQAEFDRQLDKLVTGITGLEAEIVTLQELENGGFGSGSAIAMLVAALNAAEGADVWSFVDYTAESGNPDGLIGTDAITTGIIYRNDAVTEAGRAVCVFDEASAATTFALADVLNQVASSDDQVGDFQRSRPATVATFETTDGGTVTVVSNHFKSKGDSNLEDVVADAQAHVDGGGTSITQADIDALLADPNYDQGDGQGFWNGVRTDAAGELVSWLASSPTGVETDNVLITGDLNAYGLEDPVDAVLAGSYGHLVGGAPDDYGFTFFGQQGALDHALASAGLLGEITGAAEWHINADEPVFLDYNLDFEDAAFFAHDTPYRASDHDPVLVGLSLEPDEMVFAEFPDVRNGRSVDPEDVNGVAPQSFLSGDQSNSFEVELLDPKGTGAGFKSAMGVYEVDEAGNIVDVELLFDNVKRGAKRGETAVVDDVEDGHDVGFFLLPDAWKWARKLDDDAEFSFLNASGDLANVSDGASIHLAVDGVGSGRTVLHSYDMSLNADGLEHVLSGFDPDAGRMTIGFEDLLGGGDRDYEDVVFAVSEADLGIV